MNEGTIVAVIVALQGVILALLRRDMQAQRLKHERDIKEQEEQISRIPVRKDQRRRDLLDDAIKRSIGNEQRSLDNESRLADLFDQQRLQGRRIAALELADAEVRLKDR